MEWVLNLIPIFLTGLSQGLRRKDANATGVDDVCADFIDANTPVIAALIANKMPSQDALLALASRANALASLLPANTVK